MMLKKVLGEKIFIQPLESRFNFINSNTSTTPITWNDRTETDFTNSWSPNNSSFGAADTTAGRIYFSTPSTQVRIPVRTLLELSVFRTLRAVGVLSLPLEMETSRLRNNSIFVILASLLYNKWFEDGHACEFIKFDCFLFIFFIRACRIKTFSKFFR